MKTIKEGHTMKAKHTPGPWDWMGTSGSLGMPNETWVFSDSTNQKICDVINKNDAALIAAAPCMYAWLVKEYSRCAPLSQHGRELAALIARAWGRV